MPHMPRNVAITRMDLEAQMRHLHDVQAGVVGLLLSSTLKGFYWIPNQNHQSLKSAKVRICFNTIVTRRSSDIPADILSISISIYLSIYIYVYFYLQYLGIIMYHIVTIYYQIYQPNGHPRSTLCHPKAPG